LNRKSEKRHEEESNDRPVQDLGHDQPPATG
jgi:hypothetical protein